MKHWKISYQYNGEPFTTTVELSKQPDLTYALVTVRNIHISPNTLLPQHDRNATDEEHYRDKYGLVILSIEEMDQN